MAGLVDMAKNFVVEKVAHMKKPEASVTDVDLKDVSRECITYNAKVSVINPYSTSVPICEISYTFKSADRTETSLLREHVEVQTKELTQRKQRVEKLEEKERVVSENDQVSIGASEVSVVFSSDSGRIARSMVTEGKVSKDWGSSFEKRKSSLCRCSQLLETSQRRM